MTLSHLASICPVNTLCLMTSLNLIQTENPEFAVSDYLQPNHSDAIIAKLHFTFLTGYLRPSDGRWPILRHLSVYTPHPGGTATHSCKTQSIISAARGKKSVCLFHDHLPPPPNLFSGGTTTPPCKMKSIGHRHALTMISYKR